MKKLSGWAVWIMVAVASISLPCCAQSQNLGAAADSASTSHNDRNPDQMSHDELFRTIKGLDTELFDAYNHCELDKFASFLPEHLEFYHDQGGLVATTRQQLVASIKQNICGKVHRELVTGTLEVYPLKGYGAVELGTHTFSHPGIDTDQGEAKFVQLWRYENGKWFLTRVISYDHHNAADKK